MKMFNYFANDEIDDLKKRVRELEIELITHNHNYAYNYYTGEYYSNACGASGGTYAQPNYTSAIGNDKVMASKQIPMQEIIDMILEHNGLEIKYTEARQGECELVKKLDKAN